MANVKKFVYVPTAAKWEANKQFITEADGKWFKSIVFRADTNEIWNRGVAYGMSPENAQKITNLESLKDTLVSGGLVTKSVDANGKESFVWALDATKVAYDKTDDKVIASATTVAAAIKELDAKISENKEAECTYKTRALTAEELAALNDANIKEAYKTVKLDKDGNEQSFVGDIIKVYKDSSLKSSDFVSTDGDGKAGQFLKLVYVLADGSEDTVYVDMSALIEQSEVENGIQQKDGKLSIKLDATTETFLTVGADGIKLAGVQSAIDTAKAEVIGTDADAKTADTIKGVKKLIDENEQATATSLTDLNTRVETLEGDESKAGSVAKAIKDKVDSLNAEVTSTDGTNIQVKVTESEGKISAVNVATESYATITTTTSASGDATFAIASGDEGKLVKASDLKKAVDYIEDIYGWEEL